MPSIAISAFTISVNTILFSIERAGNKYYDINTIVQMPNNDVLLIYTVCADSTGKLYNYLDVNRHKLRNYTTGDTLGESKVFLHDNPDIDLSNFDRYNLKLIGSFNPFHIVGSMIVDQAFKMGGETKVLEILSYTSINDVFEKGLKIDSSEVGDFIKKKSRE